MMMTDKFPVGTIVKYVCEDIPWFDNNIGTVTGHSGSLNFPVVEGLHPDYPMSCHPMNLIALGDVTQ